MAQDFSKYTGSRSDAERREEIGLYVKSFEKKHGIPLTRTSEHRGSDHAHKSHNHEFYGAIDLDVTKLSSKQQKLFIRGAAARGLRIVDEVDARSGNKEKREKGLKRGVIHLDLATREEIGNKRWSFSKNKEVGVDAAGTIRKESNNFKVDNSYGDIIKIARDTVDSNREIRKGADDLFRNELLDPLTIGQAPREEFVSTDGNSAVDPVQASFKEMMADSPKPVEKQEVPEPDIKEAVTIVEQQAPQEQHTTQAPRGASNELEVLMEQDQFVAEAVDTQLAKAQFAGGRRPAGIGVVEGVEQEKEPSIWDSQAIGNMGGTDTDFRTTLESLGDFMDSKVEGSGLSDLGNKVIDRTAIGLLTQNAVLASQTTGVDDPNYDATKEPELFNELTNGLENDQLKDLLETYGSNRHDFILGATSMQASNKRHKEMQEFSQNNPVMSGVNTVGTLVGEAAAFSFAASAVSQAASGAIKINAAKNMGLASRALYYGTGEIIEQGLEEIVWAKYARDYEFDPKLFGLAIMAGTGIRSGLHNSNIDKSLREILDNEGGFIQLSSEKGKKVVDELTKHVTEEKAIALIKRLEEKKVIEANKIRKILSDEKIDLDEIYKVNRIAFKKAKKGTQAHKALKSEGQKLRRQITSLDKRTVKELDELVEGTHELLRARLNPNLSIKKVAEGLDIPKDIINDKRKLRKFLGIDSPEISKKFVIDGDKGYEIAASTQLEEMATNKRLNANETMKYLSEQLGDNYAGNKLYDLASTDGPISRYLYNKGNLVSSENELVSSYYNWLAPDGMGRTGASKIRAVESQQRHSQIINGQMMESFRLHGDEAYALMKGSDNKFANKIRATFNVDEYENEVTELFKQRLLKGKDGFRESLGNDKLADVADDFTDSFNRINDSIIARAKELGVEGIEFDSTEDWFHRSWDFRKARSVDIGSLEDSVFEGMKKHLDDIDMEFDIDTLKTQARAFTHGIRNADITRVEGAQKSYIEYLTKLVNKNKDGDTSILVDEISRLTKNMDKAKKGDLAHRVQMDVDVPIRGTDMKLSDILEENFINTQKRYNNRMSSRIAAAEHGVKDINHLDDWVNDAIELEVKRLADKGVENPKLAAQHVTDAMKQDLKSFKNGHISGLGDILDDSASDMLRFVKKYNFATLMQDVGISSIAEMGGTVAEVGFLPVMNELRRSIVPFYKKLFEIDDVLAVDKLYQDTRVFTGIGLEDFSFSSIGTSKGERIFKTGAMGQVEKGVDVLSRTTQSTFGHIETLGRRVTNNSLVVSWANHFNERAGGDLVDSFFKPKKLSNRVLENVNMGTYDAQGVFKTNELYTSIKEQMKKHAKFDERGNLVNVQLHKWDSDLAHKFGETITAQSNHIFVNPDSTTMAVWQTSTIGQVLNQFRTFSINATTKVAGYSAANAQHGLKHGDAAEINKMVSKIFWGTTLGTMSIMLRDTLRKSNEKELGTLDIFDEGAMKAAAIGLSRSSIIGNMPTLVDTIGSAFGADPFFEKSSSIGRSRSFFNLETTPTGQAISKVGKGASKVLQGEFKEGGMSLMKASPLYRQLMFYQILNFKQ